MDKITIFLDDTSLEHEIFKNVEDNWINNNRDCNTYVSFNK